VTVVSVVASVVFVILLSFGVRFISAARVSSNQGSRSTPVLSLGYAFIGCAGLLVLYCLYLIVPQFH
jgi:hypothetical protein